MRHLARKHGESNCNVSFQWPISGLYGDSIEDATFADMVYDGLKDIHTKYCQIIYREYEKKPEFVANQLPKELEIFERLVKMRNEGKGLLLGGDKVRVLNEQVGDKMLLICAFLALLHRLLAAGGVGHSEAHGCEMS